MKLLEEIFNEILPYMLQHMCAVKANYRFQCFGANQKNKGMIEVKLKRNEVEIKSPWYIGCTVLWYSKMLMFDFIYNCLYQVFSAETTMEINSNF